MFRKSDPSETAGRDYQRHSRFAETADGWFFLTREGVSVGPYESLFDAQLSASLLVTRLSQLDEDRGAMPIIQEFFGDPSNPVVRPGQRAPSPSRAPRRAGAARRGSVGVALSAVQKAWSAFRQGSPA